MKRMFAAPIAVAIAILLALLLLHVGRIQRSVDGLLEIAGKVGANTANIPQLEATAPVLALMKPPARSGSESRFDSALTEASLSVVLSSPGCREEATCLRHRAGLEPAFWASASAPRTWPRGGSPLSWPSSKRPRLT